MESLQSIMPGYPKASSDPPILLKTAALARLMPARAFEELLSCSSVITLEGKVSLRQPVKSIAAAAKVIIYLNLFIFIPSIIRI